MLSLHSINRNDVEGLLCWVREQHLRGEGDAALSLLRGYLEPEGDTWPWLAWLALWCAACEVEGHPDNAGAWRLVDEWRARVWQTMASVDEPELTAHLAESRWQVLADRLSRSVCERYHQWLAAVVCDSVGDDDREGLASELRLVIEELQGIDEAVLFSTDFCTTPKQHSRQQLLEPRRQALLWLGGVMDRYTRSRGILHFHSGAADARSDLGQVMGWARRSAYPSPVSMPSVVEYRPSTQPGDIFDEVCRYCRGGSRFRRLVSWRDLGRPPALIAIRQWPHQLIGIWPHSPYADRKLRSLGKRSERYEKSGGCPILFFDIEQKNVDFDLISTQNTLILSSSPLPAETSRQLQGVSGAEWDAEVGLWRFPASCRSDVEAIIERGRRFVCLTPRRARA